MSTKTGPQPPDVAGLILAAGMSTRAGRSNKLLHLYAGQPLVRIVSQALENSRVTSILMVLGHESQAVKQAVEHSDVATTVNTDFQQGALSSSLIHGVRLLYEAEAVVVCLGDMPHISAAVIDSLISAMIRHPDKSIFIPVYRAQRGNPVLMTKRRFNDILRLTGDQGARVLVQQRPDTVIEVPTDNEGVLIDYDTAEELEALGG